MFLRTMDRVQSHTAPHINERIDRMIEASITHYAAHPEEIDKRLDELDREWDIERALETQAASIALTGAVLGSRFSRKWFVLPGIVGGFLLMHAIQGWCPPIPLMRRLGIRTPLEIDTERYALKALRGDFNDVPSSFGGGEMAKKNAVLEAVRRNHYT